MLIESAIMLDYAHTKNWCYYAQNYASIICQTLVNIQIFSDSVISIS